MQLSEWLEHRAGLSGRKLDGALKMCDLNYVDNVSDLRELVEDEESKELFEKTFPQSMIRKALIRAFKADTGDQSEQNASGQIALQAKEDTGSK